MLKLTGWQHKVWRAGTMQVFPFICKGHCWHWRTKRKGSGGWGHQKLTFYTFYKDRGKVTFSLSAAIVKGYRKGFSIVKAKGGFCSATKVIYSLLVSSSWGRTAGGRNMYAQWEQQGYCSSSACSLILAVHFFWCCGKSACWEVSIVNEGLFITCHYEFSSLSQRLSAAPIFCWSYCHCSPLRPFSYYKTDISWCMMSNHFYFHVTILKNPRLSAPAQPETNFKFGLVNN